MSRDARCQTMLRSMIVMVLCWGGCPHGEVGQGGMGSVAEAAIPRNIHYQGKLTEPGGSALIGDHTVTLRLYDAATSGTQLWQETHTIHLERADNGVFSVVLGSQTPFDVSITFNNPLWLSIDVDGQGEFSPRQLLAAVSYAINADQLNGVSGSQYLRGDIDTATNGQLKLTLVGAAFLIKPSTDLTDTTTKMIDLQNATGISKFSVDAVGNVAVAGNLNVSGVIGGAASTTGTTNTSWTIGSGTEATSSNLSLLFGQTSGQQSIAFNGAGTSDFVFSAPIRLATESALRLEGSTAGGTYVALKAPSNPTTYTLTFPSMLGTTGQLLGLDATGNLTWLNDVNSGGTITGVTAGTGLAGGGTSGTVTLDVGAGNGIQVTADDVAVKLASGSGLVADATGLSLLRSCTNGQLLKWNATANTWACAADDNTASGGTLTSITAGTGLTGGTITTAGTIAVDVGTTANKIVQLDSSAKLPAVDGSLLTGLSATNLTSGTVVDARLSSNVPLKNAANSFTAAQTIAPNSDVVPLTLKRGTDTSPTANLLALTNNAGSTTLFALDNTGKIAAGSADASLLTSGTFANTRLAGPLVSSITAGTGMTASNPVGVGAATISVDVGTTANKIVQLDASAKFPAVDGSALTNLNASNVSSGTLALARGGTGATTASAARANLSAAASGPNSDITSLSGVTTPLSVAQGGTSTATLTQGGLLIGQGTSAVTTTGVLAKGTLIVGDGVTDPALLSVGGNHGILMADTTQASGLRWASGCMPIGGADATNRSATFQMAAFGASDTSSRGDHLWPVPASGTVTTLRAFVNQAPSGSASWVVRLRKNGANASLNCTIAGAGASCSMSGTDTFAAGDRLGVEFTESGSASGTQGSGWSACLMPD